jgi:hypothetical protein
MTATFRAVFDRLSDASLAEELRAEQGRPPSRPGDPGFGRRRPGWVYTALPNMGAHPCTPGRRRGVHRGGAAHAAGRAAGVGPQRGVYPSE